MRGARRAGDRGALESLRRYSRYNVIVAVSVIAAVLVLVESGASPTIERAAVVAAGLAVLVLSHRRWTLRSITGPVGLMPWWQAGAIALVGVGMVVASTGTGRTVVWSLAAGLLAHDLRIARFPQAGWRFSVPFALLVALAASITMAVTGNGGVGDVLRQGGFALCLVLATTYAEVTLLGQWHLTLELEKARRDAAELATTRERLRFAEDLHDILGHALEVVSFKSELASRLSEVDPVRSRAELDEIQRLARGAIHDVRALVQGRRSTEFAAELPGVRALLESAGIGWEFTGDPAGLDGATSELLGRVLREAVTNLLRHAAASRCTVRLETDDGKAVLMVGNDGVAPMRGDDREGSGLRGLARRITEVGGMFSAGVRDGVFEVRAEVPR
ncbi:sensor histidine kinase [Lentzea kentuckyensis]|uniref:sensor histidine kinase n=1 Tax=Lentzea kentuckyensis TaxID=360086 RepID=UPI000A3C9C50|nr:histidine kinase [Lentzea kentuckyensis]